MRAKFLSIISICALGMISLGIVSYSLLNEVKVGGQLYGRITDGKDLIADILPPPEYIIESYLVVTQMTGETDRYKIQQLADRLTTLKKEYYDRREVWEKKLESGALKTTLLRRSYEPVEEFYRVVERDLVPAALAGRQQKVRELAFGQLGELYTKHREAILEVVELANGRNAQIEALSGAIISSKVQILTFFTGLFVLVVFALGWMINRVTVGPIKQLTSIADRLCVGDARQTVTIESKDEIGQLADSFRKLVAYLGDLTNLTSRIAENDLTARVKPRSENDQLGLAFQKMITNFSALVRQLADSARELASAASQVAAAANQMSSGSKSQADRVSQVTAAVEEMSATILESSRNAGDVRNASQEASDTALSGGKIVNDTVLEMQHISDVVRQSADSIGNLAKSADQIGQIISVIDDIASQTNLLALNAAIEAARAGEQGRGFAVVADEVRKLAERTGKATGEISSMIKGIQSETSNAVSSMQNGLKQVDHGRELADKAGSSLTGIVTMSQQVVNMIMQIATAANEQSAAAEEISRSIEGINTSIRENATGAAQSATAAEELHHQAEQLQQVVAKFKVN
ncbi:MAG: HAMP domain-containing protein [bacterium]|nr:HAMP domain-containing protein [bacterium]